jgi:lipid-binding SYLF domain-containing protein
MRFTRRSLAIAALAVAAPFGPLAGPLGVTTAAAASRADMTEHALGALHKLEATEPRAARLAGHAKGILVFPSVLKAGFIFGGETGNGVLFEHGRPVGYYNLSGGSWGLQIGGQDFSYALYFMTDSALNYLKTSDGFSAGTGPSITVVNKSAATEGDITTATQDVYAFPFNGKGLMADLTLEGTKISRIHPRH